MIVYNVTVNIDDDVHDEWLDWMINTHIPEVMATGKFTEYRVCRILSRQEDETGQTYSIQYIAKDMTDYEDYQRDHAPALQQKTSEKYGEKFVAFRTLMEMM